MAFILAWMLLVGGGHLRFQLSFPFRYQILLVPRLIPLIIQGR